MHPKVIGGYAAKMARESGKRVSRATAEAEIHRIILEVVTTLSKQKNLVFGYHTKEDIINEGFLLALEGLSKIDDETGEPKYDVTRPLDAFIYRHVKNRLLNKKRDTFLRSEPPCPCCDAFNPPAEPCEKWKNWNRKNAAKVSLMKPVDVSSVASEGELGMSEASAVESEAEANELLHRIDANLPQALRPDYLRLRAGTNISQARKDAVRSAVMEIIGDAGDA